MSGNQGVHRSNGCAFRFQVGSHQAVNTCRALSNGTIVSGVQASMSNWALRVGLELLLTPYSSSARVMVEMATSRVQGAQCV